MLLVALLSDYKILNAVIELMKTVLLGAIKMSWCGVYMMMRLIEHISRILVSLVPYLLKNKKSDGLSLFIISFPETYTSFSNLNQFCKTERIFFSQTALL